MDVALGVWISRDPLGYLPQLIPHDYQDAMLQPLHGQIMLTSPENSSQLFEYLVNNPVGHSDPSGLCPPGQAPYFTECPVGGDDGVVQDDCETTPACLMPCVYAHENTHATQLTASCVRYQADETRCLREGDCSAVNQSFSDWRSPCHIEVEECQATQVEYLCLLPCAESTTNSCCGLCAQMMFEGYNGRPSTLSKLSAACDYVQSHNCTYSEYVSPYHSPGPSLAFCDPESTSNTRLYRLRHIPYFADYCLYCQFSLSDTSHHNDI